MGAVVFAAGILASNHRLEAQIAVTPGDLVLLQAANGTVSSGQSVSLLEYTPSADATSVTLTQTIAVPSSTSGATNEFVITGNSTAGGILSLNANNTVTFAGYRADVGTANLTANSVNRVLGTLNLGTGTVNTNLNLQGSSNTFRGAAVNDTGTTVYLSGANGILAATTASQPATPNSTAVATTTLLAGNTRQVSTFNGNLFLSSGSSTPGQQVFQLGGGEPTTGTQTTTGLFGSNQTASQYNSYAFARLGTGTAYNGFDTIYTISNTTASTSAVQKFTYSGTGSTFTASGALTLSGVNDIAIRQNAANGVNLFVTTASNSSGVETSTLQSLTDTSGFGGSLSGSFSTLVTDTGTQAFYGIAFDPVPVPEPATVFGGLLLVGALGWNQRRRFAGPLGLLGGKAEAA